MKEDIMFYRALTPEQQDLVDRTLIRQSYRKGQLVHRHGDSCVGIIYVRTGRLAFSIISEEGREITISRAEPGMTCVLSAACVFRGLTMESSIVAEVPTEVSVLPAPVLAQLMQENKDVDRLVYKLAAQRFSMVVQTLERVLFFSLERRLALFLREECARRRGPTFAATHEQIARYIGSSREVVTRALNQLAGRGIVALGRGTVTVLDPDTLDDLAE